VDLNRDDSSNKMEGPEGGRKTVKIRGKIKAIKRTVTILRIIIGSIMMTGIKGTINKMTEQLRVSINIKIMGRTTIMKVALIIGVFKL